MSNVDIAIDVLRPYLVLVITDRFDPVRVARDVMSGKPTPFMGLEATAEFKSVLDQIRLIMKLVEKEYLPVKVTTVEGSLGSLVRTPREPSFLPEKKS